MRRVPGARLVVLACIACALVFARAPLDGIDGYVSKTVQEWKEPGLAIAIVKDDQVVLLKGYGVRKLGGVKPVDPDSIFEIGSLTKAFTAAALGMLVDEGKLHWDDRVIDHMPDFRLYDPWVTREIRVRDLLCHRSGLPAYGGDLMAFGSIYNRQEIIHRLRFIKPVSSFRSAYAYQNLMVLTAGQLIPRITGKTWDEFVRERIFAPLGMRSTYTSTSQLPAGGDVAAPHIYADGKSQPDERGNYDNIGPAGSINSTVRDMAQWIRLQLGAGTVDGRKLFSEEVSREMWSARTPIHAKPSAGLPAPQFQAYGLGWGISEYRGHKLLNHAGALSGMTARIAIMPDEKLGFVILTNGEVPVQTPLMYRILDAYLGAPERDWSSEALTRFNREQESNRAKLKKEDAQRATGTKPPLTMASYAGTYRSDAFGDMKITQRENKLEIKLLPLPGTVGDAEYWQYGAFRITWRDPGWPKTFLLFRLNANGSIADARLQLAEGADPSFDFQDYVFEREHTP